MAVWIKGNRYLSDDEMLNNAKLVKDYLIQRGWSINAVCGLLGNMESESHINPGIWQNLTPNQGGWGMVQWTPYTNFTDWADENGYAWDDGYAQLLWIDTVTTSVGQWIVTTEYNLTFNSFKKSVMSPEYLASAFLKNFERAGVEVEDERRTNARKWYNTLQSQSPDTPTPLFKKHKGFNFLLFCRRRREQRWH